MCGIAGILDFKGQADKNQVIHRMTGCLAHRGPDATGYYSDGVLAFGHQRLSIIDLSAPANQPMKDHSGKYLIVFNGEIYNYREIKKEIPEYPYTTHGDTEAILAAYIKWGPACVSHLTGMFAFAIWDTIDRQLFLARDRFGVKPLYYAASEDHFLFASEIRAIISSGMVERHSDPHAISEFLQFQSVGDRRTIVKGIASLEAGTYLLLNQDQLQVSRYWDPVQQPPTFNYLDKAAVKKKIKQLLSQSVERRMVSDVPIGAFLSGGIDSSTIVGLMASHSKERVNTFTVGFEESEFDESSYAEMIAQKFNTRHNKIILKAASFLDELVPALNAMDTPSGDGVNSFVVSKAIRQNDITVALSGAGGDELFAGYPIFRQYLKLMRLRSSWKLSAPIRRVLADALNANTSKKQRLKQFLNAKDAGIASFYPAFRQIIPHKMLSDCTHLPMNGVSILSEAFYEKKQEIEKLPLLSQLSVAEYAGYTKNTLLKDMDQMSMAVSLELREPFFDHELVEFVLQVPDSQKFPAYPKQLLVESMGDLLPYEIVHRKKQGFLFPWKEWMKHELAPFCEKYINDIGQRDFIKKESLLAYWRKFLKNDPSVRWMELWLFIVLEYWLQRNDVG